MLHFLKTQFKSFLSRKMLLTLKRISQSENGTFGVLLKNNIPLCVTLEDPWNDNKKNISCIPNGTYKAFSYNGTKYKNVWILDNVEDRYAILIHQGNTIQDTRGCILVGQRYGELDDKPAVLGSRLALNSLRKILPSHFDIKIINC